jgi:hypothetical protein
MIRPDERTVKAFALAVRQFPEILEYFAAWRTHELDQLPNAINNAALMQGRCQVLGEIYKLVKESPELAAKSH